MATNPKSSNSVIYEFGDFCLIPLERVLLQDKKPVSLSPKVFDALVILVENHGHLIEKNDLLDKIWEDAFVEEATLARTISRLRKSLGKENKYIETVAKSGYRFTAPVNLIEDIHTSITDINDKNPNSADDKLAEQKDSSSTDVQPNINQRWYAKPPFLLTGGIVLISVIVLAVIWRSDFYGDRDVKSIRSIAVLPFKTLGKSENDKALELAMADALITKLSNVEKIVVLPTSAIYRYAEKDNFDSIKIGLELNVDAILDGTIQKHGRRLRVNVQLINVDNGNPIWSDKFESEDLDIFVLQDNISEQITDALELKLSGKEKDSLKKRYTENREAYKAYIKGRYLWSRRNPTDFKRSLELFQKAIEIDPNYALAYTGIADCYQLFAEYRLMPINEGFAKARTAARKALELDESLAEAHASLGYTLAFYDWDFAAAEKEFKRAIELNPNYSTAYQWYAEYLLAMQRPEESYKQLEKGKKLDPNSLAIEANFATYYMHHGNFDKMIEIGNELIQKEPKFPWGYISLDIAYFGKNDKDKYVESNLKVYKYFYGIEDDNIQELKTTYDRKGWEAFWRKRIELMDKETNPNIYTSWEYAVCYTVLKEDELAIKALEKSYNERNRWIIFIRSNPVFKTLLTNPKFQEIIKRIGFPTQNRSE